MSYKKYSIHQIYFLILFITFIFILPLATFSLMKPTYSLQNDFQFFPTPTPNPNQHLIDQYDTILTHTWNYYKTRFIQNGQVIDPAGNITTSEGQSYALLRAVYLNDHQTFEEVWRWTANNLQIPNRLFAWRYQNNQITDAGPASDADQDIATALLLAYEKWQDPRYLTAAQEILNALWQHEVAHVDNKPYLIAGTWANRPHELVLNPSYFSPAQYRHFSLYDSTHPWLSLVDTSYEALHGCTTMQLGKLPPEWCTLNKQTKQFSPSTDPKDDSYSYNAIRTPLRIALDYTLSNDHRAKDYLDSLSTLSTELTNSQKLFATYSHNGITNTQYESALSYAGNFGYFLVTDPNNAHNYIQTHLTQRYLHQVSPDQAYWEDPNNYYTQNIAWFATALYSDSLK